MSEKCDKAKELFLNDYNCSQSTLAVFSKELGLDFDQSTHIAAGFGAGMCYQGKTCGAVTGGYMALGLISGKTYEESEMVKENTYQLVRNFNKKFELVHGSLECRGILGIDLSTDEGIEEGRQQELFTKKCPLLVESAVKLIEETLEKRLYD
jgi:C_GCAxxG_C_C family probable redox protein